jgi:catechol 2,3-dioxygenase-like lactoylglutathione lyase family enzyme
MRLNQVTLPAADIAASATFYRALGFRPVVLQDHYCRFQAPTGDATLSIHIGGVVGDAAVYLETETLDADVARLRAAGVMFETDPTDQSWLWREAWLRDPAGNRICLFQPGENRLNPPWRVPEDQSVNTASS